MSDSHPTVSVLMPVRDAGEHLYEAMSSLVSQSLGNIEVVCVDDGSTDGSGARLDEWAARDARIRVEHQAARGIVSALERARALARAPLLARMDADDVAEPARLERQLRYLEEETELAGCGCHVRYFPASIVRDGARRYEAWLNSLVDAESVAEARFVECPLAHPTFMVWSDALDDVGGYADGPWPEDYDLVLRLFAGGHRLGVVPEVLHHWREHGERLSRTDARYAPDAFLACKVHHLRETLLPPGRPVIVWGAGPIGKRWSKALSRAGANVVAFVDVDPKKVGQTIHDAPVLDGSAWPEEAMDALQRRSDEPPLHLAAVGQPGARERIRGVLESAGARPLRDFVEVA
ncbi:MAG: glycosyltransferase [Gemmatimonadota bacterium]